MEETPPAMVNSSTHRPTVKPRNRFAGTLTRTSPARLSALPASQRCVIGRAFPLRESPQRNASTLEIRQPGVLNAGMSDPYKECGLEIFNEVVLGKGGQAEIREILKKHFPESPPVASYEDFRQAGVLMDQKARENAGEADRPYFRSDGKGASGIANDWNNLR